MKSLNIAHGNYNLTVSEANVLSGMRRSVLKAKVENNPADDDAVRILRFLTYPDLISAVTENSGFEHWPPTFEQFLELPEALAEKWERAVYELNPHWRAGEDEQTSEEKKVSTRS